MRPVILSLLALGLSAQQPGPAQPARARELGQQMSRGEGRLKPGDPAPDFTLKRLRSQQQVQLSEFRGKRPVALVFGSYT